MSTWKVPSLRDALADVPDFRQAQGRRYELLPVLLLCGVAVMCGARAQAAIAEWGANYGMRWLSRLGISRRRRRGPSQPTLHRIFKALDGVCVEQCVTCWVEQVLTACTGTDAALEALSLDGKTLRGSAQQGAAESHLLGAVSQRPGLVVAQLAVADKSHQVGEIESLLIALVLEGRVVTCEALHTHASVAQTIIAGEGDYLLPVKDHQPVLRQDMALVFGHAGRLADTITEARTTDQHGGRIETRWQRASTALEGYQDWPGDKQVLELRRTVTEKRTGETGCEVAHAITSLGRERATARQLLEAWRGHWHIENRRHWVRDVTFEEDRSQVRAGHARQVMAILRNIAITLLRLCGAQNIAAGGRRHAAQPALALAAVGIRLRE
jgi:predicted transposase YbfD/YdcC